MSEMTNTREAFLEKYVQILRSGLAFTISGVDFSVKSEFWGRTYGELGTLIAMMENKLKNGQYDLQVTMAPNYERMTQRLTIHPVSDDERTKAQGENVLSSEDWWAEANELQTALKGMVLAIEDAKARARGDGRRMSTTREALAELEHDQWIAWSKNIAETESITPGRLDRWRKLWRPYADLTEAEKDQDREWADRAIAIVMAPFVAVVEAANRGAAEVNRAE